MTMELGQRQARPSHACIGCPLMGWSRPCSYPAAIEAGISRGVLIIIVSTAAMHAPFPTWVKLGSGEPFAESPL
jgi:hypothetical protein